MRKPLPQRGGTTGHWAEDPGHPSYSSERAEIKKRLGPWSSRLSTYITDVARLEGLLGDDKALEWEWVRYRARGDRKNSTREVIAAVGDCLTGTAMAERESHREVATKLDLKSR